MGRKKVIKKVSPAPAPPKADAYSRFYDMGTERLTALDTMLLKDEPMSVISRTIQEDWGLFTDVKNNTLQKQIQRYRDHVVLPRLQHLRAKEEAGYYGRDERTTKGTKVMLQRLVVMDEWEQVLAIQKARILKMYEREKGLPTTMDGLSKLFKDYQHGLAQYGNLQLETGYLKRAPKVLTGTFGFSDDPDQKPVFEFAYENKQLEVGALQELSDLLENDVLEGSCTRVEPRR